MLAFLAASVLGSALKLGARGIASKAAANATADVAAIPPKAKLALLAIALLIAGYFLHQHYAHAAISAADQGGYQRAKTEDAAELKDAHSAAITYRQKYEQAQSQLAEKLKGEHDAKITSVGAAAADIVRSGPGKASCGRLDYPAAPTLSGGQKPAAGAGDAALAQVPDSGGQRFIALPFNDAIRLAGQCDINRDEALKARQSDDQQRAAWENVRAAGTVKP